MELYNIEQTRFSHLQGSFQKMLNMVRKTEHIDLETETRLMEINSMIDKMYYSIEELSEHIITNTNYTNNTNYNDPKMHNKIKQINNDNKVISSLIPLAIMYRMTLAP
jgi:hypothetical protein